MSEPISLSASPSPYAQALCDLVLSQPEAKELSEKLKTMEKVFAENKDYLFLLDHPGLDQQAKKALLKEAFETLEPLLELFFTLLIENRLMKEADVILAQANDLIDEANGLKSALVETTLPLTEEEKERLQKTLEKRFSTGIKIREVINPALIGGIRVQVGNEVIDHSIARQLEGMRQSLKEYSDETQPS